MSSDIRIANAVKKNIYMYRFQYYCFSSLSQTCFTCIVYDTTICFNHRK